MAQAENPTKTPVQHYGLRVSTVSWTSSVRFALPKYCRPAVLMTPCRKGHRRSRFIRQISQSFAASIWRTDTFDTLLDTQGLCTLLRSSVPLTGGELPTFSAPSTHPALAPSPNSLVYLFPSSPRAERTSLEMLEGPGSSYPIALKVQRSVRLLRALCPDRHLTAFASWKTSSLKVLYLSAEAESSTLSRDS